eukprot:2809229-Amphidinium_carterae.1
MLVLMLGHEQKALWGSQVHEKLDGVVKLRIVGRISSATNVFDKSGKREALGAQKWIDRMKSSQCSPQIGHISASASQRIGWIVGALSKN